MRKAVQMKVPISLYSKIEEVKKRFKEVNGFDISMIGATELIGNSIRLPKIPNLIKNEKKKFKGRSY